MLSEILDILPIVVASSALILSIYTFFKKQKSDQFRIALDINDRLEKATNELISSSKIAESTSPQVSDQSLAHQLREQYLQEIKSPTLHLLSVYEFFSLLVNKNELTNLHIIKYFKRGLILDADRIFKDYPEIAQHDEDFKETKNLLRKWKKEDNSNSTN
jgi:hypothetical protein